MKNISQLNHHYYFLASHKKLENQTSFNSFFFNSFEFFISGCSETITFYIIKNETNNIAGRLNLCKKGSSAFSPYKAPFGSLEFEKGLSPQLILEFWKFMEEWCIENQVEAIFIKSYPAAYSTENTIILANTLITAGYVLTHAELNQHININDKPFFDRISYSAQKRIKKCIRHNFEFSLSDLDHLEAAYHLIKSTRLRKNYPVTMSYEELRNVFLNFPDKYLLFVVTHETKIIALSVSIRVNKEILYNFYHAHDEIYDQFSPITLVVQGIYEYCQEQNIKMLDLGISTANNVLNEGLFRFKKNFGAETSLKLSFKKNLA